MAREQTGIAAYRDGERERGEREGERERGRQRERERRPLRHWEIMLA
jgi:hypothetical protein